MKTIFSIAYLLTVFSFNSSAQISIVYADMPIVNDSIRISRAANFTGMDFNLTDSNYIWDFSLFNSQNQYTSKYVNPSSTGIVYTIVFNPLVSNLACARDNNAVGTIQMTGGYNYYNKSVSGFKEVGFGAEINGTPLPVKYDQADIIYKFPINYQNVDSCDSKWQISIQGLGYIGEQKHRVNVVDGWGTVKTPYGSFQCLRLKSTILQKDTFHYDSIPFSIPAITRNITEYYWLSKDIPFPILKVTKTNQTINSVEYVDSIRHFVEIENIGLESSINIYPQPASNYFDIKISPMSNSNLVQLFNISGKEIFSNQIEDITPIRISTSNIKSGIYFLKVSNNSINITKKIIIIRE